jgi:ribonuclease PH
LFFQDIKNNFFAIFNRKLMRQFQRKPHQLRDIHIENNIITNAEGSCLITFGNTRVICTATIEEKIPSFLSGKATGWITAEYGMLPRSTHQRVKREAVSGKQSGRTQEIQRLIGRSLRAIMDLKLLGERQIIVDCDVIQADGGTRTASITAAYVAVYQALSLLVSKGKLSSIPLKTEVAAVSCGIVNNNILLDLDYQEDSTAEVDANFVINGLGEIVEIQGTAETKSFSKEQFNKMLEIAEEGVKHLITLQRQALNIE